MGLYWSSFEHSLTKVDQIFCKDYYGVSGACNEWLSHFHIKAKGVLYNSIDLEEVKNMQANMKKMYREKYNILENATVITLQVVFERKKLRAF